MSLTVFGARITAPESGVEFIKPMAPIYRASFWSVRQGPYDCSMIAATSLEAVLNNIGRSYYSTYTIRSYRVIYYTVSVFLIQGLFSYDVVVVTLQV